MTRSPPSHNNWVDSNGTLTAITAQAGLSKDRQFQPSRRGVSEDDEEEEGPAGPKPVLALDATRDTNGFFPHAEVELSGEEIVSKFNRLDPSSKGSIDATLWLTLGQYIDLGEMDEELRDDAVDQMVAEAAEYWKIDKKQVDLSSFEESAGALAEMKKLNFRERVYHTFDDPGCCTAARYLSVFILLTIAVSSAAFVLETMPSERQPRSECTLPQYNHVTMLANGTSIDTSIPTCEPVRKTSYEWIERITIAIFTVEYLLRFFTVHAVRKEVPIGPQVPLWIVPLDKVAQPRKKGCLAAIGTGAGRTVSFFFGVANLIDFVAIAPFYITLITGSEGGGTAVIRVLRLTRVFRVFKVGKSAEGVKMLGRVMMQAKDALFLLLFFTMLGTVVFGSVIYFAEGGEWTVDHTTVRKGVPIVWADQKGAYVRTLHDGVSKDISPFQSIPASFWWVMVTMTTVGYGDMYPTTNVGKFVGAICMISGVLVLAMPISIVGTYFSREYDKFAARKDREREKAAREKQQRIREAKSKKLGKSTKGTSLGAKKIDNMLSKMRPENTLSPPRDDVAIVSKELMLSKKNARSRALEIADDIAVRAQQASVVESLAPRRITEQFQAEACNMHDCTSAVASDEQTPERREAGIINSLELSLQLLRQMQTRGGQRGTMPPAQVQHLQNQLVRLSHECLLYMEFERRQLRYEASSSQMKKFSLPGLTEVTDISDSNEVWPKSFDPQREDSARSEDSASSKGVNNV
jgi:hypothetical protein